MKKDSRKYNIYHGVMAGGRWVLFAIVSFISPVSGILDFYFLYYTFRRIIQNTD